MDKTILADGSTIKFHVLSLNIKANGETDVRGLLYRDVETTENEFIGSPVDKNIVAVKRCRPKTVCDVKNFNFQIIPSDIEVLTQIGNYITTKSQEYGI